MWTVNIFPSPKHLSLFKQRSLLHPPRPVLQLLDQNWPQQIERRITHVHIQAVRNLILNHRISRPIFVYIRVSWKENEITQLINDNSCWLWGVFLSCTNLISNKNEKRKGSTTEITRDRHTSWCCPSNYLSLWRQRKITVPTRVYSRSIFLWDVKCTIETHRSLRTETL